MRTFFTVTYYLKFVIRADGNATLRRMKNKWGILIVGFVLILGGSVALFLLPPKVANAPKEGVERWVTVRGHADILRTISVKSGDTIDSSKPLVITGEARGNWYFEASFFIEVFGESFDGLLGNGIAQAQDEWMTEEFVPFATTVNLHPSISTPGTSGKIILHKDNPSGLPENDDRLIIPVKFK